MLIYYKKDFEYLLTLFTQAPLVKQVHTLTLEELQAIVLEVSWLQMLAEVLLYHKVVLLANKMVEGLTEIASIQNLLIRLQIF